MPGCKDAGWALNMGCEHCQNLALGLYMKLFGILVALQLHTSKDEMYIYRGT